MATTKVNIQLDIPKVMKNMDNKIQNALKIVGGIGVTVVSKQLRANGSVRTGNLLNSITYSTKTKQQEVKSPTTGKPLKTPKKITTLRIGTSVVYAPRLEFGFTGTDSLGRYYDQPTKSFLRAGLTANKSLLEKVFTKALKNQSK